MAEARRHGRFKVPAAARSAQTQAPRAPAGGARSARCALAPPHACAACVLLLVVPAFNTHCESSPLRRRCFTLRALVTTRSAAFARRPPFTSARGADDQLLSSSNGRLGVQAAVQRPTKRALTTRVKRCASLATG